MYAERVGQLRAAPGPRAHPDAATLVPVTIRVALEHRTSYDFDRPVRAFPHTVRLRPAPHTRTPIEAYSLQIEPREHFLNWQQDPFGNFLARVVFPEPVSRIEVVVDLVADLTVINPFDFFVEDYAQHYGFAYPADLRADLAPYLAAVDEPGSATGPGPVVRDWLAATGLGTTTAADSVGIVDFLVAVNRAVTDSVAYSVRMEHGVHSPDQTLTERIGSCRDSAWLLVSVLRQLGLAARFVSGYLVQLTSDVAAVDGPSGPAQDFTDLHAWAEVFIPGAGWVGLDATSGLLAGEGHIPLVGHPVAGRLGAHHRVHRARAPSVSRSATPCAACTRTRASPRPTPTRSGRP